ncbi:hypothetical protein Hypma_007499 [Hypsizygus marmoreus]|uniref:Protein kinase domain-containing protein n=1 Tax=Hypsizygus marmoreus TaxID=39966 RepID=A0A369JY34_HYPMA|nr:hypothetical protein Hypma_007499 [Hypsizygus marmoreus]
MGFLPLIASKLWMLSTRADGTAIALKQIEYFVHPNAATIGQLFSSEPSSSDPRNTVSQFSMFYVRGCGVLSSNYHGELASNLCTKITSPPGIATIQWPISYHCTNGARIPDARGRHDYSGDVKKRSSRTRTLIKYYLIDVGLSKIYKPDDALYPEPPGSGGDKTVPEFQIPDRTPCDPFPVDVYCLRNAIRENFLDGKNGMTSESPKKGFEFMRKLINNMVNEDPKQRPRWNR